MGSTKKGSPKLLKIFTMTVLQNYGNLNDIKHEDFILAVNYIGKDRDKQIAENDTKIWLHLVKVLLDYIVKPHANPSLAALSLKLI